MESEKADIVLMHRLLWKTYRKRKMYFRNLFSVYLLCESLWQS